MTARITGSGARGCRVVREGDPALPDHTMLRTGMRDDPSSPGRHTWQDEPLAVGAQRLAMTVNRPEAGRRLFP